MSSDIERRDAAIQRRKEAEKALNLTMGISGGVTPAWLAKAFGFDVTTVRLRLADCPGQRRSGGFIYSLREAAKYLVEPIRDIDEYLRTLSPTELPPKLQVPYWDAKLKQQKWEENARQLWRTDAVVEVFADTIKMVRERLDLWPDTLQRQKGLTPAQREILEGMVDSLQKELQQDLESLINRAGLHPPSHAEITDEEVETARNTEPSDDDII